MFCSILTCPGQYLDRIDVILVLFGGIIVLGIGLKLYDYIQRH